MNKFIYFNAPVLTPNDFHLLDESYEFHQWFKLQQTLEWPGHSTSRVHDLATPWPLAPSVCPLPEITHDELDFAKVMDHIAAEFCDTVVNNNLTPYVAWSGGIDSTAVLVSLLRVGNAEFLKKLVVLCNDSSKKENPYFFTRFIDKKFQIQDITTWQITSDSHDKIAVFDGEAGNQCMGMAPIHLHCYLNNFDFLDQAWRTVPDLSRALPGSNQFALDLVRESIEHAPVKIHTVYDFIWWTNFNFKFDYVLLRKTPAYTKNLNAEQSKKFYNNHLFRPFAHPHMQIWSMLSSDLRRQKTRLAPKWVPKNYIYEFDRNDLYLASKTEQPSLSPLDSSQERKAIVAIDQDWNKYDITDSATRKMLGQILKRI